MHVRKASVWCAKMNLALGISFDSAKPFYIRCNVHNSIYYMCSKVIRIYAFNIHNIQTKFHISQITCSGYRYHRYDFPLASKSSTSVEDTNCLLNFLVPFISIITMYSDCTTFDIDHDHLHILLQCDIDRTYD